MAEYSRSGNDDIVEAICRHYLESCADYSDKRDVLNGEIILWAYLHTGNNKLLEIAVDAYEKYNQNCQDDNCVQAMLSEKKHMPMASVIMNFAN